MNKTPNQRQIKTIQNFWRWIEDNELVIYNAIVLGVNTKEVIQHIKRNGNYVSKRIGFIVIGEEESVIFIITAFGKSKLVPKLIALEDAQPALKHLTPVVLKKLITNKEPYLKKKDKYYVYSNCKIRISDLYLQLDDYNTITKKINITVFHPYTNAKYLHTAIKTMIILVMGEMAFNKHIKKIEIKPILKNTNGLLQLIEIDELIDYI
jgi:RNA recognition motif-containing protein